VSNLRKIKEEQVLDIFGNPIVPGRLIYFSSTRSDITSGEFGIYTPFNSILTYNMYKFHDIQKFLNVDIHFYNLEEKGLSAYLDKGIYQYISMDGMELTLYNKFMQCYGDRVAAIDYYDKNKKKLKPGSIVGTRVTDSWYLVVGHLKETNQWLLINLCYLTNDELSMPELLNSKPDILANLFSNNRIYSSTLLFTTNPKLNLYYIGESDVSLVYDRASHIFSFVDSTKQLYSWEVD
jgi:hypothetical protein